MGYKTILDRCLAAYDDVLELIEDVSDPAPLLVATVMEHLAGELRVMAERSPQLTVQEVAVILRKEAAAVPIPTGEPEETWLTHPSLTVEQRNPTLR